MLVPITMLHFLNALTCSLITLFFQVHTIGSDIVPILDILGRDNSNLKLISSTYRRFILEKKDNIWGNKRNNFLALQFK